MPSNNSTASNNSKILVCVRVRPISEQEKNVRSAFECISVVDRNRLLLVDPDKFSADILRQNRAQEREFRFDAVLGPNSSQGEVQELLGAEGLVDSLVRMGHNGTVLAYGPTGTGKTHTMVGTRENPGVMWQMTRALYERLEEMGDTETRVYISFMELYNELIRDLLSAERGAPLDLLEDEHGNVQVPSLSRIRAPNTGRIMQLLQEGNARRTQEPTAANATSSRSHALLQISLWRNQQERGKLFLIDLAGSERASQTQNQGQRLKEGAAINRSLLALGNVINALSASNGRRRSFVNFRDSKLTRLLKDSLAGAADGARTVLITHVTPSSLHYDESFNTLTYASRARHIDLRLSHPPRRPASADRLYSDALTKLRQEGNRAAAIAGRVDMGHAASTGQLADDLAENTNGSGGRGRSNANNGQHNRGSSSNVPSSIPPLFLPAARNGQSPTTNRQQQRSTAKLNAQSVTGNTTNGPITAGQNQQQSVKLPRIGANLFDSLREQHLANSERQQRLRDRLLRANTEAFELEMGRQTRIAILEACQDKEQLEDGNGDEKYKKMVEKLRVELAEQEKRLAELAETRQKIEAALRKGEQGMRTLENRMRGLAKNSQEQQVIELLQNLAKQQAERSAIHSNFAIQSRRLRRQESEMQRLRRYERVADRLITAKDELEEEERATLYREYRMLRGQLLSSKQRMLPTELGLPSWNAQILERMNGGGGNSSIVGNDRRKSAFEEQTNENDDFGKTFVVLRTKQSNSSVSSAAGEVQLPSLKQSIAVRSDSDD